MNTTNYIVYRQEDEPKNKNGIWIHHNVYKDLSSPIIAQVYSQGKWHDINEDVPSGDAIKGLGVKNIISLNKDEYESLVGKDSETLYLAIDYSLEEPSVSLYLGEMVVSDSIKSVTAEVEDPEYSEDGPEVVVGQITDGVLPMTFRHIQGPKGDTGDTGPQGEKGEQGNTGSSVDYPYELVNNVTTDDATKGLSAAQGVVLDDKISQLGQELYDKEYSSPITLTEIGGTLKYDASTNKIVTGAAGHNILYKQFSEETIVSVQGTFSSATRIFMVGTTAVLPADGVTVDNPYVLNESAIVDKEIVVHAGEYLCLYYYYGTWSDTIYRTVTYVSKFAEIDEEISESRQDLYDLRETVGVIFDGSVTFTSFNNVVKTFDMTAGKVYSFLLNQDSFSGTLYFGIKDKDGNWLRTNMAVTSMPFSYQYEAAQNYPGAQIVLAKSGTNTFSLKISVNDSILEKIEELEDGVSDNASAILANSENIAEVETELFNYNLTGKETSVSYTQSSAYLEYNTTTQKIVTSDNLSRRALYRYFATETLVRVEGSIQSSKVVYICKTTQIPANDVSVTGDVVAVNTATFSKIINVQAGEYLCVLVNFSYHSNISMTVLEQLKPLVLLNERNSAPINQYDDKIVDITYNAAYYSQYPGNTYGNFLASIQAGFGGLKADMRLTSDNKIVLCHDSGYKLNSAGDIIPYNSTEYASSVEIHDKTFAEITALKFAEQVGGQDIHPCSLDDMLYLCKRYKSIPYLTLRSEDWASDTVDEMYYLLQKYGLVSKVIINLFSADETLCALLKNKDESLMICNTMDSAILNQASIDNTFNLGCCIACYRRDNGSGYTSRLLDQLTPEIIQYAASKGIRLWAWNNTTAASIEEHIKAGIVGFQNYSFIPIDDIG